MMPKWSKKVFDASLEAGIKVDGLHYQALFKILAVSMQEESLNHYAQDFFKFEEEEMSKATKSAISKMTKAKSTLQIALENPTIVIKWRGYVIEELLSRNPNCKTATWLFRRALRQGREASNSHILQSFLMRSTSSYQMEEWIRQFLREDRNWKENILNEKKQMAAKYLGPQNLAALAHSYAIEGDLDLASEVLDIMENIPAVDIEKKSRTKNGKNAKNLAEAHELGKDGLHKWVFASLTEHRIARIKKMTRHSFGRKASNDAIKFYEKILQVNGCEDGDGILFSSVLRYCGVNAAESEALMYKALEASSSLPDRNEAFSTIGVSVIRKFMLEGLPHECLRIYEQLVNEYDVCKETLKSEMDLSSTLDETMLSSTKKEYLHSARAAYLKQLISMDRSKVAFAIFQNLAASHDLDIEVVTVMIKCLFLRDVKLFAKQGYDVHAVEKVVNQAGITHTHRSLQALYELYRKEGRKKDAEKIKLHQRRL
eukprot:g1556.t1